MPKVTDDLVNDSQPTVLQESVLEGNQAGCSYPSKISLMISKESLKCRKVKCVLRYYVPNQHKYPEKYAHHLLFMFYPFRSEEDLKSADSNTYSDKLKEPSVMDLINRNKNIFEPYGDLVDSALLNLHTSLLTNQDAFSQQENDQVENELLSTSNEIESEDPSADAIILADNHFAPNISSTVIPDDELNTKICSLNAQQRQCFEIVYSWCKGLVTR